MTCAASPFVSCAPEGPDATTSPDALAAPEGLRATSIQTHRVDLLWRSVEGMTVSEYRVYRNGEVVASAPDTLHSDTDLSPATSYSYQVSAVGDNGDEGPRSVDIAVETRSTGDGGDGDDTPPSRPAGLAADAIGPSQIDLSWNAASDSESGIDRYEIYRDGSRIGSASSPDFADTGLDPETRYQYRISAVNGAGLEGERSGPAAATTPEATDDSPPSAPTDLDAEAAGETSVDLDWDDATDPQSEIAHYRVYRDGTQLPGAEPSGTSFTDTGLEPDTRYAYRVAAVNGADLEGPRSGEASARTDAPEEPEDQSPPSRPLLVGANAVNSTTIVIQWTAAIDLQSGIDHYRVYRDGTDDEDVVEEPTGRSFTDTGLEPDTRYTYRVSAVNGAGLEGARSFRARATTDDDDGDDDDGDDDDGDE